MPIGPDSPNPMIIDFFVVMWFVSMLAGIITNQTFMWFDYLFSALGGLYLGLRAYFIVSDWWKSRDNGGVRTQ